MSTFAERSERHANVLEVLCGHMATVVDGAFHRVLKAELPEQKDQAALVFDRLARGLRLTVAMEARAHRDTSLDIHIKDLSDISDLLEEQSTTLDPQRKHRDGLARISDWWIKSQNAVSIRPKRQRRRPGYPRAEPPLQNSG